MNFDNLNLFGFMGGWSWVPFAFIWCFFGFRIIGKLIGALWLRSTGRYFIIFNKDYGGGDLRRDRTPRFFANRRRSSWSKKGDL